VLIATILLSIWIETAGVLALTALAFFAGRRLAVLRRPWWMLGYAAPFIIGVVAVVARWMPGVELPAPFSWLAAGRVKFAAVAAAGAMLAGCAVPRLSERWKKIVAGMLCGAVAIAYVVFPFIMPGLASPAETRIDADGVCRQSTSYNCGPAAAVTALHKLGIEATEGELAALARTNPVSGTESDLLCSAIRGRFDELDCEYRRFSSLSELGKADVAIVMLRHAPPDAHYVAVLDVDDDYVMLGDPALGFRQILRDDFERAWQRSGIILTRRF
jgi:peptidase C39-like protein